MIFTINKLQNIIFCNCIQNQQNSNKYYLFSDQKVRGPCFGLMGLVGFKGLAQQ